MVVEASDCSAGDGPRFLLEEVAGVRSSGLAGKAGGAGEGGLPNLFLGFEIATALSEVEELDAAACDKRSAGIALRSALEALTGP